MSWLLGILQEAFGGVLGGFMSKWISRLRTGKNLTPSPGENSDEINEILKFRNDNRIALSEIARLYYDAIGFENALPSAISALSTKEFLPEEPIDIKTIDEHRLILNKRFAFAPLSFNKDYVKTTLDSNKGRKLFNGEIYRLIDARPERFEFSTGKYFNFFNSCEGLSFEFVDLIFKQGAFKEWVSNKNKEKFNAIVKFLIDHQSLNNRSLLDIFNFKSRETAFGTCALVIMKRSNEEPQFILNVRSLQLAETPNLFHVIPAGTFQPYFQNGQYSKEQFKFSENIYREFIEELINDKYMREYERVEKGSYRAIYREQADEAYKKLFEDNNVTVHYLGMVIDPLNLKPEILTTFLIHESTLLPFIKGPASWESMNQDLCFYDFTKTKLEEILNDNLVPTGKAHLHLVLQHFDFIRTKLNDI
jgi:hypothetical protein